MTPQTNRLRLLEQELEFPRQKRGRRRVGAPARRAAGGSGPASRQQSRGDVRAAGYDDGHPIELRYDGASYPAPAVLGASTAQSPDPDASAMSAEPFGRRSRYRVEAFDDDPSGGEELSPPELQQDQDAAQETDTDSAEQDVWLSEPPAEQQSRARQRAAPGPAPARTTAAPRYEGASRSQDADRAPDAEAFEARVKDVLTARQAAEQRAPRSLDDDEVQGAAAPPAPVSQRVFDELAKSMAYATTYDAGSVDLREKFRDLDRDVHIREPGPAAAGPVARQPSIESFAGPVQLTPVDIAEDFALMGQQAGAGSGAPATPPAPAPPDAGPAPSPPLTLPAINTDQGILARVMIAEARNPGYASYDADEARRCLQAMKAVVDNRLRHRPERFGARGATNYADVVTARGQWAGFAKDASGNPAVSSGVQARIDDVLRRANSGAPGRYHAFVSMVLEVAAAAVSDPFASITLIDGTTVMDGAFGWRTAGSSSPGGAFVAYTPAQGGEIAGIQFYAVTP